MITNPSQYGGNALSLQIATLLYRSGLHVPVNLGAVLYGQWPMVESPKVRSQVRVQAKGVFSLFALV